MTEEEVHHCVFCGLRVKGYGAFADVGNDALEYMHPICANLVLRAAQCKGWKINVQESTITDHVPQLVARIKRKYKRKPKKKQRI